MRAQVPVRPLRGRDPLTVEIEVQSLAAKSLPLLAPQNVADLCALEVADGLTHGLGVRLKGFTDRMARALADLPNGTPFTDEVAAFAALPPGQVPEGLRAAFLAQGASPKRGEKEKAAVAALAALWDGMPAEVFVIAPAKRAPQALPVREARGAEPRARREPSAPRPPVHRPVATVDTARVAWIEQTVLGRVRSGEGLLEGVLLTTVRHRARERYPDLQNHEIKAALRALEQRGLLRSSAGRWRAR